MLTEDTAPAPQPAVAIDQPAPDFEARSTHGPVRLSDYRGRWLVFFSHPADFTPVCTSEFIAFQNAASEFEALACALLGLSVDSVYAHLAWMKDIKERFGVEVGFPVIEDISMSLARAYGMIHDASTSTATVRSVFFIDPDGVLRAFIHYPMNVGRSVAEILRVLAALQEADARGVAAPEGWRPGDTAVLPPPETTAEIAERKKLNGRNRDWYYTETEGGER